MLEILKNLVDTTNTRVLGQVLSSKKNAELMEWVLQESNLLPTDSSIKERVFYILNNKPEVFCVNGNKKTFNAKKQKYGFCNNINLCECFKKHQSENFIPRNMDKILETRKNNLVKKYGVENVSQLSHVKEKRKATIKSKNYDSLWEKVSYNKETIGFHQVCDRVKEFVTPEFSREKYNGSFRKKVYPWKCVKCQNIFESHIDYGTVPKCRKCYPKTISKGEIALANFIRDLGITIKTNIKVVDNFEFDIFVPSLNIAFEYNGIYWHSDIKRPSNYHLNKFIRSRDNGIHLIQIFEDEWNLKSDIIKNRIKNILGKDKRIYARNCNIKEIDTLAYKKFVTENHLQGYSAAKIKYGLYYEDELVSVMSFGKSRYTEDEYEMIRFCSKNTVIGGASKLFTFFIKNHNPNSIVSYASRMWSNGNLYKTLGFHNVTENDNNLGYWYVDAKGKRYHRSTFTKKRLVKIGLDPKSSENELMAEMGFLRIFDCGNYKFQWIKK